MVAQLHNWDWTEQCSGERNKDVGSATNNSSNALLSHVCLRETVAVPCKESFSSDVEIKCIIHQSVFLAPDR